MSEPRDDDGQQAVVTHHLAQAEAALMLVECLMHVLIERRLLGTHELIDAVETAIATKHQFISDGSHPEIAAVAVGFLSTFANSVAASDLKDRLFPAA